MYWTCNRFDQGRDSVVCFWFLAVPDDGGIALLQGSMGL